MDFTMPGFSRLSPVPRDIWEYCALNVIEVNAEGQLRAIGAAGVSAVPERWSRLSEQRCPV